MKPARRHRHAPVGPQPAPMDRRACLLVAGATALGLPALAPAAGAEAWPRQAVRITLAYPPGGVSDAVLRQLAARWAAQWQVGVHVDHLPGAGGALALRALARARPDGHALCFCAISPLTVQPHLSAVHADLPDAVAPVVAVMNTPVLVLGTPALAAPDFGAMVTAAQARDGAIRWASSGVATTGHLVLEQVRRASGAGFVHVPYKGGGQQLTAALAGQFEVLSSNVAPAQLQWVQQGRLRALAVGAPEPLEVLPGVPTLAQLQYPEANLGSVFGLFAPAAIPARVLAQVHAGLAEVLDDAGWRRSLRDQGSLPLGDGPAAFRALMAADAQRHGPLIAQARRYFR
jgi:tripartite-type tricarboxylate transporter receptor subunit TctC